MATLCKQALLGEKIALNAVTGRKTTVFCLEASNQLAARMGGAASLIEAQSKQSHGEAMVKAEMAKQIEAIKKVCRELSDLTGQIREQCNQIQKGNAIEENFKQPCDVVISTRAYDAVAEALREAQAATLSVAAVTEPETPSALTAKQNMLAKIYLAAKKQVTCAKINRPYLLLLNKASAVKRA